ncbi:MAG: hypothetical protein KDC07_06580 [Chitinophagaceae bacterium]|nr:hypothetical protein [Chitinophagaceae bacterium]
MTGPLQAQKDFYDRYWQGMQPLGSYKLNRAKWIMDKLLMVRKKSAGQHLSSWTWVVVMAGWCRCGRRLPEQKHMDWIFRRALCR